MPNNSNSIISSSQATLEEVIKHNIVSDLDDIVVNLLHDSFTRIKANERAGITCWSCNDEVCAGCQVFYVYNVDEAAATCAPAPVMNSTNGSRLPSPQIPKNHPTSKAGVDLPAKQMT